MSSEQTPRATRMREPLVLEQVATVLGLQPADLARDSQRRRLGIVKAAVRPEWCSDRRVAFFDPASVEAAAARRLDERGRLKLAREGVLPPSWAGFKAVPRGRDAAGASTPK